MMGIMGMMGGGRTAAYGEERTGEDYQRTQEDYQRTQEDS